MSRNKPSLLVLYTGGTIGMVKDHAQSSLRPFDFEHIMAQVPELHKFGYDLTSKTFDPILDSSDVDPDIWVKLAAVIEENYATYDGFVILHGTDTMAYTASALSFMLDNLAKPVVFTGSQLPIGAIRTDGKENFIGAIEIAAAMVNGKPAVPEVTIFFENKLYRGNRATKHNSDYLDAFRSHNYPALAKAGVSITYDFAAIDNVEPAGPFKVNKKFDSNIAVLRIFPGINQKTVEGIVHIAGLKGLIIETFGSGNAPTAAWFIQMVKELVDAGIPVMNVTQCPAGGVYMGVYETSLGLKSAGVISGADITIEAAVTKMMYVLGQDLEQEALFKALSNCIRGEINVPMIE